MRHLERFGLVASAPSTGRMNLSLGFGLPDVAEGPSAMAADGVEIAKGIAENYSLKDLELYRCGLLLPDGNDATVALSQALANNKYLKHMGLSRTKATREGCAALAEALKVNQVLTSLDLSWTCVDDDVAADLADALLMNNSLQRLALDRTEIGDDGIGAIATALQRNAKVKSLTVSRTRMSSVGASILAKAAGVSPSLVILDLSQNAIPDIGMFSFCHVLLHSYAAPSARSLTSREAASGSALQSLNLAYNDLSTTVALLGEFVAQSRTLRELNMENCHVRAGNHWGCFVRGLRQAETAITCLSLAGNTGLGDAGLTMLFDTVDPLGKSNPAKAPQQPDQFCATQLSLR